MASAVFAHTGTAGEDQQIRRMQAAHLTVQIAQPSGQAGDASATTIGPLRPEDRIRQGPLERDEPAAGAVSSGQVEQRLFGGLNLPRAVQLWIGAERVVDDGFADVDQLPAHPSACMSVLRTRCRRLKRTKGLALVIVDYLQLMRPAAGVRQENRVLEISMITQGLKALAKGPGEGAVPAVASG